MKKCFLLVGFQQKFVIDNLLKNISKNDIMVLTPYRAQINCCLKEFKQPGKSVVITTIHGSQGCTSRVFLDINVLLQAESVML